MSSLYSGIAGNETALITKAIESSTNVTPIVLKITAHGFTTGDRVKVVGHTLNFHANGIWVITVVDVDHFSLNTSTLSGAVGGATGTATLYNLQPVFTLPSDGDNIDAASVNVGLEDAADRNAWLSERVGNWRLDARWRQELNNDAGGWASWSKDTCTNAGFTPDTGAGGGIAADAFTFTFPEVFTNDIVEIDFTTTCDLTVAGHGKTAFKIGYETKDYGVAFGPTWIALTGSGLLVPDNTIHPVSFHATIDFSALPRMEKLNLGILAIGFAGAATSYQFIGDACWNVRILRKN